VLQLLSQRGGRARALVGIAVQHREHDAVQLLGHVRVDAARRRDRVLQHRLEHAGVGRTGEQAPDGEQLVEHHPEAEQVRPRVHVLVLYLLRGDVGELALDHARPGVDVLHPGLGHAEVHQLGLAVEGEDDVARGHVAVDDLLGLPAEVPGRVGVVQPVGHVGHDAADHGDGQLLAAPGGHVEQVAQVLAGEVLHHQQQVLLVLVDVVDLDDVRVSQRGRQARLVEEHLHEALVLGQVRQDALDHHELLEAADALLGGQQHLGHASHRHAPGQSVTCERHLLQPAPV